MSTDETKGTKQDSPQEPGKAQAEKPGSTPAPEVFTKAQVEEALQKDRIARGRDAKALEDKGKSLDSREQALKAREEQITQAEKERDEAELASAREDPERLTLVQQKQALKKERADIEKARTQLEADRLSHQAEIDAAREAQREIDVWEVAKDSGLDAVLLKETCGEFNAQSREQIEKVAKALAKGKAPEPTATPTPDSGRTSGGGEKSEEQRLKERYPTMKK